MGNYKSVFTSEQKELVKYVQAMESRLFGLTTHDLRKLACQLAEKNRLPHCLNRKTDKQAVTG
jgi:hypothetical protein